MMSSKSTDDNMKKISALEKQIKRIEAEKPVVSQEKPAEKIIKNKSWQLKGFVV